MNYKYQSDLEKYGTSLDIWEVITPGSDGVYRGDCESYCRTLKNLDSVYKDWDYYYCKLYEEGHCLLYKDGYVIDCNTQRIVSYEDYCRMYQVTEFRKYNWFTVVSKILFAKGYLCLKSLIG